MNELQPLFLMPLLVGSIFFLVGLMSSKYPPKKINGLYGYRTEASMKNQQQWDFAQRYASQLTVKAGLLIAATSVFSFFFQWSESVEVILCLIFIVCICVYLYWATEKAIELEFNSTT